MVTKNLVIAFIWMFVLVISIVLFWIGESYVVGIGGPFVASVFLFLVALTSSAVLVKSELASNN